ncbi:phytochrome-like protein cph1 [Arthrobacter sp. Hiyo4]|nr:phytochrome-like protein cph1 [Arthrobacter sp. Hiyo4]
MDIEAGLGGPTSEYLRIVGNTGRRMLSMVEEVLAFATTGGGLHTKRVFLAELVKDVMEDLAVTLDGSGASVDCGDLTFTADPVQTRVLLQNLIHNAMAYRRPGVPPVIHITGRRGEDGAVLRVIDNGKDIAIADRERILDPLVRLHREGDPPGSGLGLATCSRIAAAAGGRIEIGPGVLVTVMSPAHYFVLLLAVAGMGCRFVGCGGGSDTEAGRHIEFHFAVGQHVLPEQGREAAAVFGGERACPFAFGEDVLKHERVHVDQCGLQDPQAQHGHFLLFRVVGRYFPPLP